MSQERGMKTMENDGNFLSHRPLPVLPPFLTLPLCRPLLSLDLSVSYFLHPESLCTINTQKGKGHGVTYTSDRAEGKDISKQDPVLYADP